VHTVAWVLFSVGLACLLGATGRVSELGGTKINPIETRAQRLSTAGAGVALLAVALTLYLWPQSQHPFRVEDVKVSAQKDSFARPCPKNIQTQVALYGNGRSGDVNYALWFDDRSPQPHHVRMTSPEKAVFNSVLVPAHPRSRMTLHVEVIFPEPRRFNEAQVAFDC
jgi:hypothetical protein